MKVFLTSKSHRLYIIALKDIHDLKCCDSLSVWREFPDIISTVIHRYRFHPFRSVSGKVVIGQESPLLFHICCNCSSNISLVKLIPSTRCNFFQRICKPGIPENFSFPGSFSSRHECLNETRILTQSVSAELHIICYLLRDRESFPCLSYSRRKAFIHR